MLQPLGADTLFIKGIWVHPWDLADIGVGRALEDIGSLGFNSISLAVRYVEERQAYPGPGLILRNRKRPLYLSEESQVYWKPDYTRYRGLPQDIIPVESSDVERDIVEEFSRKCSSRGLNCVFWFPVLRMDRSVRSNPGYGVRDFAGGLAGYKRYFACPNNPVVRKAILSMVEDLATRYVFNELELDYIRFPETPSSLHDPIIVFASMPCFCRYCREEAGRRGIDLDSVAGRLRGIVERLQRIYNRSGYMFDGSIDFIESRYRAFARLLIEDLLLRKWIEFRSSSIADLVASIRDTLRSYSTARLSADLYPPSISWLLGQDYRLLGELLDTVKIMIYTEPFNQSPARIPFEVADARSLLPGGTRVVVGLAGWPPQTPAGVRRDIELALGSGVDGVYLYSYGWSTRVVLEEVSRILGGVGHG